MREALLGLHARWRAGKLTGGYLTDEQRRRLSRETRVEELASLLWSLELRRESTLVPFFFLAAVFCATFEKVQWSVAGSVFLADLTASGFLFVVRARPARPRARAGAADGGVLLVFLGAFLLVYLIGFFNLETTQAFDQFGKGIAKWLLHFGFLDRRRRLPDRPLDALLLAHARLVSRRDRLQRGVRDPAAALGAGRPQPRLAVPASR